MKKLRRLLAALLALMLLTTASVLADGDIADGEPPVQGEAAAVEAVGGEDAAETGDLPGGAIDNAVDLAPEEIAPAEDALPAPAGDEADPLAAAAGLETEPAEADGADPAGDDAVVDGEVMKSYDDTRSAADNDALFDAYARKELGLQGNAVRNRHVGYDLTGVNYNLYCKLLSAITQVADGSRVSTAFCFTPAEIGAPSSLSRSAMGVSDARNTLDTDDMFALLGIDLVKVKNAIYLDCPYELYWYAYHINYSYSYTANASTCSIHFIEICYEVEPDYQEGGDPFRMNHYRIDQVRAAKANAQAIVNACRGDSDEEKIRAYVARICALTDYNDDAIATVNYGTADPWSLVYVFDGDDSTKVVCEGYSRALKYLCDLTSWKGNVYCYLACSNTHMWNLVTMPDDRSYHVDVTWTDTANRDFVLMSAWSQEPGEKYTVKFPDGAAYTYRFNSEVSSVMSARALTLANSDNTRYSSTYSGDTNGNYAVQSVSLTPGGTVNLVVGERVTLWLKLNPSDANVQKVTWMSSNGGVAGLSGQSDGSCVVTARKAGRATVTVRTYNEKTATVAINVANKAKKVKKVYLSRKGTIRMARGTRCQLSVSYSPWNARASKKWKSSKKSVASVNGSGLIYAKKKGKTTITVTSGGKKAKVKVIVY